MTPHGYVNFRDVTSIVNKKTKRKAGELFNQSFQFIFFKCFSKQDYFLMKGGRLLTNDVERVVRGLGLKGP